MVCVTCIEPDTAEYDVAGNYVTLDYTNRFFFPKSAMEKKARIKLAREHDDINILQHIDAQWIDLRAAFAQTVNKSQGSTFKRVYIDITDITDIAKCSSGDQIARMMYVAVSRAQLQVFMTGDF
jgi:ATP-dependent exoDNAse (exonuclease V) alpha subunit